MQRYPTKKAVTKVTPRETRLSPRFGELTNSYAAINPAPAMTGTPSKKLNRAAEERSSPRAMPVDIVTPLREMPGKRAATCAIPIAIASVGRKVVRFLVEESSYITGQVINVNGGLYV